MLTIELLCDLSVFW